MLRPYDVPIVLLLLVTSFIPLVIFWHQQAQQPQNSTHYATISIDGKIVRKVTLSGNKRHYQFTLHPHPGEYNIIEVDGARIRDKEDNTPDQIAVHTSWIRSIGQQSICLPHKLIIRIRSTNAKENNDASDGLVQP
ncbi:NusG domain II-containing protein [Enterococcus avium]|uniref:NusG domain II-containing protein n=1 Tax=Enterococcus avium TaxID=33945 RepID=A0ABD5F6K1_ENTAV|nr:NusG domain II-containing protein [Enterococcus avium]MDT2435839.1 NusG domain II-containing protein [Enterococcus avium]MDT2466061.1 NusG domain II-containing protein [Enterococcus avium]MDT2483828.1 NusG domain II-containing protein [Enterococcus avium]MDT2505487.1 NusG domain II-containing protein [Enterococcus avium]MDT2510314.1 NusG domain II-containing protein [Enterococcus avium]